MGRLDGLPKNPKAEDLLPILADLEAKVAELQEIMSEHQAGATTRQNEVNRISAENQRLRWALAHGRKP